MGAKPTGLDEEHTAIFHGGEAARFSAVVFRGRLCPTRQEIGISIGAACVIRVIREGVV